MKKLRIFCDMDGVLVDWDAGFRAVCPEKITAREYEAKYGRNSYWDIINKYGVDWWTNLEWMPDGYDLWHHIINEFPRNQFILSAPSRAYSIEGKLKWLKRNVSFFDEPCLDLENWDGVTRIILGKNKYLVCSGKNDILIDDTAEKLNDWIAVGGTGILHKSAAETIKKLEELKNENSSN